MFSISVIIPCYRDASTLARAIDSVCSQTREVNEIIVVNDCSPETESIENVLQNYPDVIYTKNSTNVGLAATRNKGVEIAKSEVVTFLDADDELHPQKIELQSKVLQTNCATTTNVCLVHEGQNPVSVSYTGVPAYKLVNGVGRMLFGNHLTGASMMIHKENFIRVGGYDTKLRSCEDFDLWLRLLDSGVSVRKVRLPLYFYHFNADGLSQNFSNISFWELEVLKKYFSSSKLHNYRGKKAKIIFSVWLLRHFSRAQMASDNDLEEITKKNETSLLKNAFFLRLGLLFIRKSQLLRLYSVFRKFELTG